MKNGERFLYSSVMTATATIMALMLTMLSVSRAREGTFKAVHYDRVRQIALVDTVTFAAAIILGYAAVLGRALISIILLLYNAITDMMSVVHPDQASKMLMQQD